MKVTKSILTVLVSVIMIISMPVTVSAAVDNGGTVAPTSGGLILYSSNYCSSGNKRIYINATVSASDTMAEIGFKNIKVQQSTSGSGGWTTYFSPSNQIITDADSYALENFLISVPGGYYYRFELTNYAKEYGWFFPDSQSFTVTSNVVYVA